MTVTPLIFTIHGNLPLASLEHQVEWRVSTTQIIFIERYLLDGQIVKESSHVHNGNVEAAPLAPVAPADAGAATAAAAA